MGRSFRRKRLVRIAHVITGLGAGGTPVMLHKVLTAQRAMPDIESCVIGLIREGSMAETTTWTMCGVCRISENRAESSVLAADCPPDHSGSPRRKAKE